MVRIRLRRVGARHQPSYRIVVADKESPRDGRFLENIGFYNPRTEPSTVEIQEDRLFHWLKNGAQPSDAVVKVLKSLGTWDRWERYKEGEDLETLLEEVESKKLSVDQRTRRDDLAETRRSKKKVKVKEEAAPTEKAEAPPLEKDIELATVDEETKAEPAIEVDEQPVEEDAPEERTEAEEESSTEGDAESEAEEAAEADTDDEESLNDEPASDEAEVDPGDENPSNGTKASSDAEDEIIEGVTEEANEASSEEKPSAEAKEEDA